MSEGISKFDRSTKDDVPGRLPLFVYGTLLPEQPNGYLWDGAIVSAVPATLPRARLYDMGYYPMVVEAEDGEVIGRLITVQADQYDVVLSRLDSLEGFDPAQPTASAYRRVARFVQLSGQTFPSGERKTSAWVYVGHTRYVTGRPMIEPADWNEYTAARRAEMAAWWAHVDTVLGLHKPES